MAKTIRSKQAKGKRRVSRRLRSNPALLLPFVKLADAPRPSGKLIDYWAPPKVKSENGLDPFFRGDLYARMVVQHMRRHPHDEPLLIDVIGSMVEKGRFWAQFSDGGERTQEWDSVAIGFVRGLAGILAQADRFGLVTWEATDQAARLEDALKHEHQVAECARPSVKRGINSLRAFADANDGGQWRLVDPQNPARGAYRNI